MKLIFSSPDLVEVNELKELLEDVGITCVINNEVSSQLLGGVPTIEATPELWIEDDARLAEAEQVKKDWEAAPAPGPAWTCPKCGEKSEAQFTSCWKCGTLKP